MPSSLHMKLMHYGEVISLCSSTRFTSDTIQHISMTFMPDYWGQQVLLHSNHFTWYKYIINPALHATKTKLYDLQKRKNTDSEYKT
jgi:hypothetical protein